LRNPTRTARATVTTPAYPAQPVDPFSPVLAFVEENIARLRDLSCELTVAQLEVQLLVDRHEYGRRMLQARLDARAAQERAHPEAPPELDAKAHFRTQERALVSVVGEVVVRRLGWQDHRHLTIRPADAALNLPPERYSLTVRRFVAEQVAFNSFDTARRFLLGQRIDVAKRQAEQLVVRMASDFAEFYAWNQAPANECPCNAATPLLMSCDGKGVRVIFEGLREATRQAALNDTERPRGDPMAQRKERTHDRRMAVVCAVWDQECKVRDPLAIVDNLRPMNQREFEPAASQIPRPTNKRVWALLACGIRDAVGAMFDEAERRDPERKRRWVVLLDGADEQRRAIEREAERRGVQVTILMDLLHVLHYLWEAATALHGGNEEGAETWVRTYVGKLLTRPMVDVVAGIRQSATLRGAKGKAREAVEVCTRYLSERSRWMDYPAALVAGLPIATGVIEGACRHLVQDRMGITGACWSVPMAEAVLRIRALIASGHWEAYVRFHAQREHFRNYSLTNFKKAG
jgi:hypothetical protein